jgi:hypothetical protein
MPQAQFIPTKQIDPEEQQRTILAGIQLSNTLQQTSFENQLLTQRMNLEQQKFGLDQQIAQVNMAGQQQAQDQSAATFGDRQRSIKATADIQTTDAGFRAKQDQQEVDSTALAQQMTQLQMTKLGLDVSTQKRMAPIMYSNALQQVEQTKAQTILLGTQNKEIKDKMALMQADRNDRQVQEIGQQWHLMTPTERGAARAAYPNSILKYMPDTGDPEMIFNQTLGNAMSDNNISPEAKSQAYQLAGMAWAAHQGIHDPQNPMANLIDPKTGKPLMTALPSLTQQVSTNLSKSSTGGTGKAAAQTPATGSDALDNATTTVAPKFEYTKTGIGDLDNTLYHASQHAAIGETTTMADVPNLRGKKVQSVNGFLEKAPTKVERSGTTFNYDSKILKPIIDTYDPDANSKVKGSYLKGTILDTGDNTASDEMKAVKSAMIVDPKASLRQQTTYETFLKTTLDGDLTTKSGLNAAKQNVVKLLQKVGPDAITQPQKDALTSLLRYFDGGE